MSLLVMLQEVARAATDLAPLAKLGAALAASIATIGAAMGISKIGSSIRGRCLTFRGGRLLARRCWLRKYFRLRRLVAI